MDYMFKSVFCMISWHYSCSATDTYSALAILGGMWDSVSIALCCYVQLCIFGNLRFANVPRQRKGGLGG